MNLYKTLLFIFPFLLIINELRSQEKTFGVTANIGLSKWSPNPGYINGPEVKFSPSGSVGMFFEKRISHNSSIGAELIFVHMVGKEVMYDEVITETSDELSDVIGVLTTKVQTELNYLSHPVYYKLHFGKVGIKGGLQPMVFLYAYRRHEFKGELYGKPEDSKTLRTPSGFDFLTLGAKFGIDYKITNKIRLGTELYYGLHDTNLRKYNSSEEARMKQISIGFQYSFNDSRKSEN